uniref:Connector enhancer of kinase suppressor of ras 2 n=1 Tax=Strigamia maritima TaxID=126957 RepID=T1IM37_STRMM
MQVTWPTMASVNISEWGPEQVAEWLRGLDDAILPYVHFFLNNAVTGHHLLMLSAEDLPHLNVTKLGHQDLIVEAVDLLRHFHYSLDTENLQSLSLKLSCKARSLYNDLKQDGKQERVTTPILSTVANILVSVKCLVSWLDRNPFLGQKQYAAIKNLLLHLSIELATNAVRDRFAEKPIDVIKNCCLRVSDICDKIIQESQDPLIIQPASIDVATGLYIHSSYSGIHIIGEVKLQSPAQLCGRIDVGDEVVQVNYQNVVGWQLKKLVLIMKENPTEIVLTLKKRPHHSNMLSQIFARSFFHSKKSADTYVPRFEWQRELRVSPTTDFNQTPYSQPEDSPKDLLEVEEEEDQSSGFVQECSTSTTDESIANLFVPRQRATIQRRATVTGISPNALRAPINFGELWLQVQKDHILRSVSHDPGKLSLEMNATQNQLRNLEAKATHDGPNASIQKISLRPNTCLGTDPATEAKIKGNAELCQNLIAKKMDNTPIELNKPMSSSDKPTIILDKNKKDDEKLECRTLECDNNQGQETFNKAASLPRTLPSPKYETMSNPNLFTESTQSYQVIIAGGVPHIAPPSKEGSSPNESPVLRRKGRTWEFANRRVSCKDLGMGDCQGWLYKRKEIRGIFSGHSWIKRWCVLKNHNFYCFVEKDDLKAESLIYLPGFNVSPAAEIKTKKHSFKVYHTGTTFYYASDSQRDMSKWMNKMGLAAIAYDASKAVITSGFVRPEDSVGVENLYYSETEYDSEEGSFSLTADTKIEIEKSIASEDTAENRKPALSSNTLPKINWKSTFKGRSGSSSDSNTREKRSRTVDFHTWSYRSLGHRKLSAPDEASHLHPKSANISSISLQSVKVKSTSLESSANDVFAETLHNRYINSGSGSAKQLSKRVHVGKRGWVSFEKSIHKREPSSDKILRNAVLSPAFEMNLDSSPPPEDMIKSSVSEMLRLQQPKTSNILAKLGLSPRNEKKTQRRTKWFDGDATMDLGSSSTVSSEEIEFAAECKEQRNRLVSSSCQTDLYTLNNLQYLAKTLSSWSSNEISSIDETEFARAAALDSRKASVASVASSQTSSSWEFFASDKRGGRHFRTEMTVHIGRGADTSSDESTESTRSPRKKPTMGVSMIGKNRRSPGINSIDKNKNWFEGTLNRGSNISIATTSQATQTDTDDDLIQLFHTLHTAELTIDGTHVGIRRNNTMLTPHSDKRRSQLLLLLRSLQRTLKSKEQDLYAIEEVFSSEVTRRRLRQWIEQNPHLCQSFDHYSSSDYFLEGDL